jgi:hypothetical protein
MTNHNTPQLSQMDLPIYCAAFPGPSLLNTRAELTFLYETQTDGFIKGFTNIPLHPLGK